MYRAAPLFTTTGRHGLGLHGQWKDTSAMRRVCENRVWDFCAAPPMSKLAGMLCCWGLLTHCRTRRCAGVFSGVPTRAENMFFEWVAPESPPQRRKAKKTLSSFSFCWNYALHISKNHM